MQSTCISSERERQRQTDRDKETERDTDRQRQRQRGRERNRKRTKRAERETETETESDRETETERDRDLVLEEQGLRDAEDGGDAVDPGHHDVDGARGPAVVAQRVADGAVPIHRRHHQNVGRQVHHEHLQPNMHLPTEYIYIHMCL